MEKPERRTVIFDGTTSSLVPLGTFQCLAISNVGGPWRVACVGTGDWAAVGERVWRNDERQLCRVKGETK